MTKKRKKKRKGEKIKERKVKWKDKKKGNENMERGETRANRLGSKRGTSELVEMWVDFDSSRRADGVIATTTVSKRR